MVINAFKPTVASAAFCLKVVVLLLIVGPIAGGYVCGPCFVI